MMSRHDLHAEREWIAQMAERNERARRIKEMRRRKIPVDDHEETLLLLFVVGVVNVLALIGVVVWVAL